VGRHARGSEAGGLRPHQPVVREILEQNHGGHELQPERTATTIRFNNGKPVVTDGPFIEGKETIGGYAEVTVADLDEAIAMAKEWPTGGPVEVRPVIDRGEPQR